MFYLIPGANEPIELTIGGDGTTLPTADKIVVSLIGNGVILHKTDSDLTVSGNTIQVAITQAESLQFRNNTRGKIQVNWLDNSTRFPTLVADFYVGEQLYNTVMS